MVETIRYRDVGGIEILKVMTITRVRRYLVSLGSDGIVIALLGTVAVINLNPEEQVLTLL